MLNKTDNKKDSEILDLLTKKSEKYRLAGNSLFELLAADEEQNRNLPIDHTLNTRFCWLLMAHANESEERS